MAQSKATEIRLASLQLEKCSQYRATSTRATLMGTKALLPSFNTIYVVNEGNYPAGQPTPSLAYATCHRTLQRVL